MIQEQMIAKLKAAEEAVKTIGREATLTLESLWEGFVPNPGQPGLKFQDIIEDIMGEPVSKEDFDALIEARDPDLYPSKEWLAKRGVTWDIWEYEGE